MIQKNNESLAGKLLLAMPMMGDPRFYRSVILICAHDQNGAMGLVLNNVLPGMRLHELLHQLNITDHSAPKNEDAIPVLSGGPIENARGFILHSRDFLVSESITITDDISVTGTVDALKKIALGDTPKNMIFALGYAGWTAGQLEKELQDNAWLVIDSTTELVFNTTPEEKWTRAMHALGIDPAMLSGDSGRA